METFFAVYAKQLPICVQAHPAEYGFNLDMVPDVLANMKEAFRRRSYNKDGHAIKATCKILKIKQTYKEINHFMDNHV
jgi:hypothetical protein